MTSSRSDVLALETPVCGVIASSHCGIGFDVTLKQNDRAGNVSDSDEGEACPGLVAAANPLRSLDAATVAPAPVSPSMWAM